MISLLMQLGALCAIASGAIMTPYEKRPRIMMYAGHMMISAGDGKNISFNVNSQSGSTINFGDLDIRTLPSMGSIGEFRQQFRIYESRQNASHVVMARLQLTQSQLQRTLSTAQSQLNELRAVTTPAPETNNMKRKLRQMEATLNELKTKVNTDECASNPCRNGGTCIDAIGKYYCLCLDEFTGPNCGDDVNECLLVRDSTLACKNGGTCLNTHGGYQCQCPTGFFGTLCTERVDNCASANTLALCGPHGICVPQQPSQNLFAHYNCICDNGWKSTSPVNPRCEDLNECDGRNPCYPGVTCINTPGSFRCGACPVGYTGNGMQCWDIDECARNNGGCSLNPRVQCINTQGSYFCAPCPVGYRGDGRRCTRDAVCSSSPCHPSADCFEMPESETGYRCQCRAGSVGNGIGSSGCVTSAYDPCRSSPCFNGATCQATSASTYSCHCAWGYSGPQCAQPNGCLSAPCRNRGTCVPSSGSTSYTCQCAPGYYGLNCDLQQDGCGNHFQGAESGSIKYPAQDGRYQNSQICGWFIITTPGKVLNITFIEFDLEAGRAGSRLCNYDNVTLFDGPNAQSPLIGTYCGPRSDSRSPQRYIVSSTNQVHILVMTDNSVQRRGFDLRWVSIAQGCGGRIRQSTGQVTSPNYPNQYPEGQNCEWIISTDPGFQYQVTIGAVTLASPGDNCTGDMLEVRDGQLADDPIMARICQGQQTPTTFLTSMPYLFVYLRSLSRPNQVPNVGRFTLTYSAQRQERACGGLMNAPSGTIQTPNYRSGFYYSDLNCIWIIDARSTAAARVTLTFTDFDVQGSRSVGLVRYPALPAPGGSQQAGRRFFGMTRSSMCRGDYVEIRDGGQEMSPLLTYLCGQEVPQPVSSTGPQMWIRFRSDTSGNGRGFEAIYNTRCGGVFTSSNGTFMTPNFPNSVLTPVDCEFEIRSPKTHSIQINFTTSDLGNDAPYINCTDNYIEMNSLPKSAQHNRRYCKIPDGRQFKGSGGSFKIRFVSTGSTRNRGFQATFQTIDVGCGGVRMGPRGLLRSPSHPVEYLEHMYCRWDIEVASNKNVKLTFNTFSLEEHRTCDYDYIEAYESFTLENNTRGFLGRFCGMIPPPPLISSTNTMVVFFITDYSISSGGFEAVYEEMDYRIDCDRSYTADTGVISNLGYPNYTTGSVECEYRIHVQRGYRIMVTVENITLPCSIASIEIRNGPNEVSPQIHGLAQSSLCDDSIVRSIRSQGNALYMKFKVRRGPGNQRPVRFSLNYTVLAESCGGVIEGIAGAVAAPQYPLKSNQAYDCIYYIHVAEGNLASFYLSHFDMFSQVPMTTCFNWASRLEIRDGPQASSPLLKRICRTDEANLGLISGSKHHLTIRYVQMGGSTSGSSGFMGSFSTQCTGNVLTEPNGRLSSPGYLTPTRVDRDCSWTIRLTSGNMIIAHMIYFKIGDSLSRAIPTSNLTARQCNNGYLEFLQRDVLAITLNNQDNVTDVTKFCDAGPKPIWIYSKSNTLTVKFVSNRRDPENHFALEYSLSPNSCGGSFTDNTGTIIVPSDVGDTNSDSHACHFSIQAPPGNQIALRVTLFAITNYATSSGCPAYYWGPDIQRSIGPAQPALYVFNGLNNASAAPHNILCRYIGRPEDGQMVQSSSNEMFLHLYFSRSRLANLMPNERNETLVFLANWTFVPGGCGSNLTSLSGNIHSSGYPSPFPPNDECTWTITIPEGYIIRLALMEFSIGLDVANCNASPHHLTDIRFLLL